MALGGIVNLEVYYTPGHEYNLDKMMESAKAGLEYYEKNFGPFQFTQYRVLEFPRYRSLRNRFRIPCHFRRPSGSSSG